MIREQPWYRRDAFAAGLRAAGHDVILAGPSRYDRDTLLVIWNRYSAWHQTALEVERCGGRVLVAENGYIAKGGGTPKFDVYSKDGGMRGHYYALAEGWHNGGGRWSIGGPERWMQLGVELRPMRDGVGDYALVCPNRSFGVGDRMMHPDWAHQCAARLRKCGYPEIRIRPHPGNDRPKRPLSEDLSGAWEVHVWSSSAGVHALVEGIPVVCHAPHWILKGWQKIGREAAMHRLAWAQWTVEEIASGEPFRRLLPAAGQAEVEARP